MFLFNACEEDPTSIGSNLLPGDDLVQFVELDSFNDDLAQTSAQYSKQIYLGQSERLLLGISDGIKASSLMRFYFPITASLGSLIDSNKVNIVSAKIFLEPNYTFGDTNAAFSFEVFKINSSWTVDSFTVEKLHQLDYDHYDLVNNLSYSDSLINFNVDPQLIYEWMVALLDTNIADPNGFLFAPKNDCAKILGFKSYSTYNTQIQPYMVIEYDVPSEEYTDTLTATLLSDAHVIEGEMQQYSEEIIPLQSGFGSRAALHFDLSNIPQNSVINDAFLELHYNPDESVIGTVDPKSILVSMLKDYETYEEDDSLGFFVLSRNENVFSGHITNFVQKWINANNFGGFANEGLSLRMTDELESLNKYIFYGSSVSDKALRPRLKIIFSKKQ